MRLQTSDGSWSYPEAELRITVHRTARDSLSAYCQSADPHCFLLVQPVGQHRSPGGSPDPWPQPRNLHKHVVGIVAVQPGATPDHIRRPHEYLLRHRRPLFAAMWFLSPLGIKKNRKMHLPEYLWIPAFPAR